MTGSPAGVTGRTHDGDEVDLVVEGDSGEAVAFEIKAGGRVRPDELRGLRKLRSALGGRFLHGVAFTTGTYCYTAEDRIQVAPADRLWA